MEKQHKNIIHIMDKTLHLITEFTLAVGYLSGHAPKPDRFILLDVMMSLLYKL
jgi:hypothetical protein